MTEDWSAVARAINERVSELGMRQRELATRSHVSQAIVRELQHDTVRRRRSARTLEALSLALGWHAQHLSAVLHGQTPREPGEPVQIITGDGVSARLAAMEDQLHTLTKRIDELNATITTVIDHAENHRD
ncbi:MAG: XRE family transcriptional regulator [Sciscionella sp.]